MPAAAMNDARRTIRLMLIALACIGALVAVGSVAVAQNIDADMLGGREAYQSPSGAVDLSTMKQDIARAEEAEQPTTWGTALPRFWKYFGIWGVLAVVLMAATVAWTVLYIIAHRGKAFTIVATLAAALLFAVLISTRSTGSLDLAIVAIVVLLLLMLMFVLRLKPIQWPVVALALAAMSVAAIGSYRVSNIRMDRSADDARLYMAQLEQQRKAAQARPQSIAEGRVPVEIDADDRELLERMAEEDDADQLSEYEAAAREGPVVPEYQRRGKQQRDASRVSESDEQELLEEDLGEEDARQLPPADVSRADRWDRLMLGIARCMPWLALFVVVGAYLDRFNRAAGADAPLPVSNRLFDMAYPKPLVTRFDGDRQGLARMLRQIVHKGESFIYFGEADPLPDQAQLQRLMVLPRAGVWPLQKVVLAEGEAAQRRPFVFESAWFRRLCFVIVCEGVCEGWVDTLIERLTMRRATKAVARRTLNIVFDETAVPPAARLGELIRLTRRANVKVIVRPGTHAADLPEGLFEEIADAGGSKIIADLHRLPAPGHAGSPAADLRPAMATADAR